MVTVTNKKQLKDAILSFAEQIKFQTFDPNGLIKQTLREYPELLVYLSSLNPILSFGEIRARLTYFNQDVCLQNVKKAQSPEDLIAVLHDVVSRFCTKTLILTKSSIDWNRLAGSFFQEYKGYYSNLTEFSGSARSTCESEWIVVCIECGFRIGSVMLRMMDKEVDKEVERLKNALFCNSMSDGVKVYVAHNYLAKTITYYNRDDATPLERSYMQSAYGALINKKCVCQGYAEAYKLILDSIGIECAVICGKIRGSAEYHAWNVIRINGKAYHVDVTWDSLGGGVKQDEHFAKSDEFFKATRLWERNPRFICNVSDNLLSHVRSEIMINTRKYIMEGADRNYLK